jgi:ABC-2 type transport system permease protein
MSDSLVFVGRSVRHSVRSIDAIMIAVLLPVLILLLFVYVFGGAIDTAGD